MQDGPSLSCTSTLGNLCWLSWVRLGHASGLTLTVCPDLLQLSVLAAGAAFQVSPPPTPTLAFEWRKQQPEDPLIRDAAQGSRVWRPLKERADPEKLELATGRDVPAMKEQLGGEGLDLGITLSRCSIWFQDLLICTQI